MKAIGGAIGALCGARWGSTLLSGGRLHGLRVAHVIPGGNGDAGLVLIGLWLLTQLNPETLLFGNGNLRQLLDIEDAFDFEPEQFSRIEAAIAAANTLAVGLFASCLTRVHRHHRREALAVVGALLAVALLVHTFAAALLDSPERALHWLTSGNAGGIGIGALFLLACLPLPAAWRRAVAGSALLLSTVLVNLAPENPYLGEAVYAWHHGHFLNFNGLTRLASLLWPFLALPWLMIRERDPWTASTT